MHAIIGLVGPARAGKTTLIDGVVAAIPERVRRIKSLTTRAQRDESDGLVYDFVTRDEFAALDAAGQVLERVEYAGNLYGIRKDHLEDVLSRGHGICALVEDGVDYFRRLGIYPLVTVRIIPVGYEKIDDLVRQKADADRLARNVPTDFTIENRFTTGGFVAAQAELLLCVRSLW